MSDGDAIRNLRHGLRNKLASIRNAAFYVHRRLTQEGGALYDARMKEFLALIDEEIDGAVLLLDPPEDPSRPGRERERPVPTPPGPASGARLLLVDDDAAGRFVLGSLLAEDGFQVGSAGSLADASRALEEGVAYDLVVLDLHLGDGPGTELLPTIRDRLPRAKVALFTGGVDALEPAPPGFDACLPKTIDFDETLAAIRRLLASRS